MLAKTNTYENSKNIDCPILKTIHVHMYQNIIEPPKHIQVVLSTELK